MKKLSLIPVLCLALLTSCVKDQSMVPAGYKVEPLYPSDSLLVINGYYKAPGEDSMRIIKSDKETGWSVEHSVNIPNWRSELNITTDRWVRVTSWNGDDEKDVQVVEKIGEIKIELHNK